MILRSKNIPVGMGMSLDDPLLIQTSDRPNLENCDPQAATHSYQIWILIYAESVHSSGANDPMI